MNYKFTSLFLVGLLSGGAVLAAFPEKPITLVVPFPPGGGTDTVARIIAKGMSDRLGQPVVIDTKAGAGTAIGAGAVARAAPDGYTLFITSNTTYTVLPALKPKLPYDPLKSFQAIGLVGSSPLVVLAHPSLPVNNIKELVELAKKQPGAITFASFGAGTTSHMAGEMFKQMANVDILHVPYKGGALAMTDLIGGQVKLSIDSNVPAKPMLLAGRVKAIAVTSPKRSASLPDVPTIAESGYPGYSMFSWLAVVAPRGLPNTVSGQLAKALSDTLADPASKGELEKAGLDVEFQPGKAYDERVAHELPLLRMYVHKANITVD